MCIIVLFTWFKFPLPLLPITVSWCSNHQQFESSTCFPVFKCLTWGFLPSCIVLGCLLSIHRAFIQTWPSKSSKLLDKQTWPRWSTYLLVSGHQQVFGSSSKYQALDLSNANCDTWKIKNWQWVPDVAVHRTNTALVQQTACALPRFLN